MKDVPPTPETVLGGSRLRTRWSFFHSLLCNAAAVLGWLSLPRQRIPSAMYSSTMFSFPSVSWLVLRRDVERGSGRGFVGHLQLGQDEAYVQIFVAPAYRRFVVAPDM